jgi:hypothetical protein
VRFEPHQPVDLVAARKAGHRTAPMLLTRRTRSLVTPSTACRGYRSRACRHSRPRPVQIARGSSGQAPGRQQHRPENGQGMGPRMTGARPVLLRAHHRELSPMTRPARRASGGDQLEAVDVDQA